MTSRSLGRIQLAMVALLWGVGLSGAQLMAQVKEVPVDPYTGGDAAAMERAGYVSFGPFPFGENHTSTQVVALLGDEELHWIETAHFRIGCAVSPLTMKTGDKDWKKSIKLELKRLKQRLPKVKTTVRKLDPWLRTHLIAQRLEDCYAEIQRDLGVTDADFPVGMMTPNPPEKYYGEGPYLGMKEKYAVLIVKRMASNARYTRAYAGREMEYPTRVYFPTFGALGVCLSEEYNSRQLENDHALHVQLVYNAVINLVNGYRSYGHEVPPWLQLGMGHWYSRRVSPKYPVYDQKSEEGKEESAFWKWDDRALGLMKFEAFEPLADLMVKADGTQFGMEDHIQSWFLVDYLMHAQKEPTQRFLREFKDPFHARQRSPTHEEMVARQDACFSRAFEVAPAEFEATWKRATKGLKHRK